MVNKLACSQAHKDLILFLTAIVRNQTEDRFSDDLLRGIAEHPLRTGIPTGNDALQRLANNGIRR